MRGKQDCGDGNWRKVCLLRNCRWERAVVGHITTFLKSGFVKGVVITLIEHFEARILVPCLCCNQVDAVGIGTHDRLATSTFEWGCMSS